MPAGAGRGESPSMPRPRGKSWKPFVSTGVVALAEIGDKTQLLSLILAARYRKACSHHRRHFCCYRRQSPAGRLAWRRHHRLANWLGPEIMRWCLGISFIADGDLDHGAGQIDDDDETSIGENSAFSVPR